MIRVSQIHKQIAPVNSQRLAPNIFDAIFMLSSFNWSLKSTVQLHEGLVQKIPMFPNSQTDRSCQITKTCTICGANFFLSSFLIDLRKVVVAAKLIAPLYVLQYLLNTHNRGKFTRPSKVVGLMHVFQAYK